MENDYSKLLPTLFNGKDLDNLDYVESFYREFGRGDYVGNSYNTTFLGFVEDQEVRLHLQTELQFSLLLERRLKS